MTKQNKIAAVLAERADVIEFVRRRARHLMHHSKLYFNEAQLPSTEDIMKSGALRIEAAVLFVLAEAFVKGEHIGAAGKPSKQKGVKK